MNIKKFLLAIILLVSLDTVAQQKVTKYILKNAFVFSGQLQDDFIKSDIYVAEGKIVKILPSPSVMVDDFKNAKIYDLTGKYVIPGLIDSHVHIRASNKSGQCYENFQKNMYPILKEEFYQGVTTVRDMGGDGVLLATAARSSELGIIPSPDIYFSAFMAGKEYYNLYNFRDKNYIGYVPEENMAWQQTIYDTTNVVESITRAKASGARGIKIYNDINKEMVEKLSKEAHRQNMKVWGHATIIPALPMDFINAGANTLSHIDLLFYQQFVGIDPEKWDFGYETQMSMKKDFSGLDDMLKAMKEKNVILDATYFFVAMNYPEKSFPPFMLKKIKNYGIKVSTGTDWMYDEQNKEANIHREMREMIADAGYTPKEMIHSATVIGAESLGLNDRGIITEGKKADMLILNANPFNNINNLKKIKTVIKTGIMYEINPAKKRK